MPPTESERYVHTIWTSGGQCCCLMATASLPVGYHVQLCEADRPILVLRVKNLSEAAVVASELRDKYGHKTTH